MGGWSLERPSIPIVLATLGALQIPVALIALSLDTYRWPAYAVAAIVAAAAAVALWPSFHAPQIVEPLAAHSMLAGAIMLNAFAWLELGLRLDVFNRDIEDMVRPTAVAVACVLIFLPFLFPREWARQFAIWLLVALLSVATFCLSILIELMIEVPDIVADATLDTARIHFFMAILAIHIIVWQLTIILGLVRLGLGYARRGNRASS